MNGPRICHGSVMITPHLLLVYHSSEGQTAKVAARIAATANEAGASVDVSTTDDAPYPGEYDVVILGDSIHAGHHSKGLTKYITGHLEVLNGAQVALFQVSLTSATDDEEHSTMAHRLVQDLLDKTGLDPDMVGLFAGALAYTRYGWFKRHLMRRIARSEGSDTDMSVDHEYTDWEAVDEFARNALAMAAEAAGDA